MTLDFPIKMTGKVIFLTFYEAVNIHFFVFLEANNPFTVSPV
jgi:hypothetical protein